MREEIFRYLSRSPVPIAPKRLATSQQSGEWPSPRAGKGFDFRNHRQYALGDDPRSVHMAMTVRAGEKMVVERIAMRDVSVLVVLDCSPSMGVRRKAEILLATALILLYSGVSMEMRVGTAFAGGNGYRHAGMGSGMRHAQSLFTRIEQACSSLGRGRPVNLELPRREANRLLPVSGILLYISDFLDARGYPRDFSEFTMESRRYDFIPVVVQDEFDCTFPELEEETLLEFRNPETGYAEPVWIGRREREMLKNLNEARFEELRHTFASRGTRFIHVMSPVIEQIHLELTRFFALR